MMHFDLRNFLRIGYLSFFRSKQANVPLTPRRILFLVGFFTIFSLVQLFNGLCFLLDALLFPKSKDTTLKKPLFIIGVPRSGTTYLHRLIAKDSAQFFHFKTWELIFPSVGQKKFWSLLGNSDRLLGGIAGKTINHLESRRFQNFNKIHRISLFSPEEDDKLLAHIFSFHGLVWFFPFPKELSWLTYFDQLAPPSAKKRIMNFYKECLKRQAYCKGENRHLLSKNPFSSFKIDSLYRCFPDCRIVYLLRNPLEAIPSMLSMATEILRTTSRVVADSVVQEEAYEIAKSFYEYPLQRIKQAPPESYVIVKYEDLVAGPGEIVRRIYRKFGYQLSPEYLSILEEEAGRSRGYKSRHDYSLDQFVITPEQIMSDLHQVFEEFNFDRDPPPSGGSD